MFTLVIWFLALVTVIGSSYVTVEGSPAQGLDINKVLGLVQQLQLNKPSKQRLLRLSSESSESESRTSYSSPDTSSDSDDSNRKKPLLNLLLNASNRKGKINSDGKLVRSGDVENARLAKERIIDLIETVDANEKKKNDRMKNRKGKLNRGRNTYLFRSENYDSSSNNVQKQIIEKVLSQISNIEERKRKPKKRLIPNRLTPTMTMDDVKKYYGKYSGNINKNAEVTGLEDYSKVYIVLNPQAVKNSKNKNALNDLISKVLSLSSQTSKRDLQQVDPFRYKGFIVKRRHVKDINDNVARMGNDENLLAPPPAAVDSFYRITAPPILF